MYGFGIISSLIWIIIYIVFRGLISGTILNAVTMVLMPGRYNTSECYAASFFTHLTDIFGRLFIGGVVAILGLFDIYISRSLGIENALGNTNPTLGYTMFRVVIMTIIYTYFTHRFLNTDVFRSFIASLVTVVVYFLLGGMAAYFFYYRFPNYEFGMIHGWF